MATLGGDRELRIGESEIHDCAQPLALQALGDDMGGSLGGHHQNHRDPERLAADATVEAVEEIAPIHARACSAGRAQRQRVL